MPRQNIQIYKFQVFNQERLSFPWCICKQESLSRSRVSLANEIKRIASLCHHSINEFSNVNLPLTSLLVCFWFLTAVQLLPINQFTADVIQENNHNVSNTSLRTRGSGEKEKREHWLNLWLNNTYFIIAFVLKDSHLFVFIWLTQTSQTQHSPLDSIKTFVNFNYIWRKMKINDVSEC